MPPLQPLVLVPALPVYDRARHRQVPPLRAEAPPQLRVQLADRLALRPRVADGHASRRDLALDGLPRHNVAVLPRGVHDGCGDQRRLASPRHHRRRLRTQPAVGLRDYLRVAGEGGGRLQAEAVDARQLGAVLVAQRCLPVRRDRPVAPLQAGRIALAGCWARPEEVGSVPGVGRGQGVTVGRTGT